MTAAPDVAEQATSQDPAVGLRAVAALRRLADQLEALQVANARRQGWSWDAIGALGRGIDPQQGNPRRVAIMRRIQGQRMAAAFDLEAIRSGQSQDPDVYPGDIVVVQSNNRRGFFQDILQALPLLAIFRPF